MFVRAGALIALGTVGPSLAACSSSDGESAAPDAVAAPDASVDAAADAAPAGDPSVLVGAFQVRLVPAAGDTPGYTQVLGKVYDGPTPDLLAWSDRAQDGDCKLRVPRVPFCATPCGGSAACVDDDVCQPYPTAHGVGTVHAHGLRDASGATDLTLEPVANAYQASLPYPAFAEGADIRLDAEGGDFAPFSLQARGIAPLHLRDDAIALERGHPLDLSWTPPAQAGSRVHVKLDISHHGGTKAMIECDTEDSGSIEVSAALVAQLLDFGAAGYPTIVVTRNTVGSATIVPGRVDFLLSSEVEQAVTIPGLASCTVDADCPQGRTCQSDLTCR